MAKHNHDWEIIGSREPFFGVIVSENYRADRMDAEARQRFYATGENDIATVLSWFDADFGERPTQGAALDIGCGVGRLSYALAKVMPKVVGYDVSTAMLRVAKESAPSNLELVSSLPDGPFAWINSYIVFQHIPPAEGLALLEFCLDRAAADAFASIQITGWRKAEPSRSPLARIRRWRSRMIHRRPERPIDSLIQMYDYNFSDVLRCFTERGFSRLVLRHTDHGDHHGAWVLGRRG